MQVHFPVLVIGLKYMFKMFKVLYLYSSTFEKYLNFQVLFKVFFKYFSSLFHKDSSADDYISLVTYFIFLTILLTKYKLDIKGILVLKP